MSYEIERQRAYEIAKAIHDQGFRVFLAERGTYGFFTDAEGSRVISFQCNGVTDSVSGNYVTKDGRKTGTGWRIADSIDPELAQQYFDMYAPSWAVGSTEWRFATLEDHLARYGDSSRYTEVDFSDWTGCEIPGTSHAAGYPD